MTIGKSSKTARVVSLATAAEGKPRERGLSDIAYDQIRRDIIRCVLRPDEEITESQLAARYGFGKAPIRSALLRLAQDEMVVSYPRRGYVIAPITLEYVKDLFDYRAIVEPAAVRLAIGNVDEAELRELDRICTAGYVPGDRESEQSFLANNKAFHVALARASGNRKLAGNLERLLDEMERLFHVGLSIRDRTKEMQHEHKSLIDALMAGDAVKAEEAVVEQIESARQMVLDAIMSSPKLQQVSVTLA
ncbi:MAG TPA: GntR family transcriptional regulator [Alphaproteobacteria bacterium]